MDCTDAPQSPETQLQAIYPDTALFLQDTGRRRLRELKTLKGPIVAVLVPFHKGRSCRMGRALLRGVALALRDVRLRATGHDDQTPQPLHLVALQLDEQSGDDKELTRTLMAMPNVVALIGSLDSPNTQLVANALLEGRDGMPLLSPASSVTDLHLTDAGVTHPWMFRPNLSDRQMLEAGMTAVLPRLPAKDPGEPLLIYAIHWNSEHNDQAIRDLRALCPTVTGRQCRIEGMEIEPRANDPSLMRRSRAIAKRCVQRNCDLFVPFAYGARAAVIMQNLRAEAPQVQILTTDANATTTVATAIKPGGLDGVVTATPYEAHATATLVAQHFRRTYVAGYGMEPDAFAAFGYDAGVLFIDAFRRLLATNAGQRDLQRALSGDLTVQAKLRASRNLRNELRSLLGTSEAVGVLGPFLFNEERCRVLDALVLLWQDRQMVVPPIQGADQLSTATQQPEKSVSTAAPPPDTATQQPDPIPQSPLTQLATLPTAWLSIAFGLFGAALVIFVTIVLSRIPGSAGIPVIGTGIAAYGDLARNTKGTHWPLLENIASEPFWTSYGLSLIAIFLLLEFRGTWSPALARAAPFSIGHAMLLRFPGFRRIHYQSLVEDAARQVRLHYSTLASHSGGQLRPQYVPLKATVEHSADQPGQPGQPVERSDDPQAHQDPRTVLLDALLNPPHHGPQALQLVILGPGGQGKSALMRELYVQYARKLHEDKLHGPIPLYCVNPDIADPLDLVADALRGQYVSREALKVQLSKGHFILWFDGLGDSRTTSAQLKTFLNHPMMRRTPIVIAMRPYRSFMDALTTDSPRITCRPLPLDQEDLQTFIRAYTNSDEGASRLTPELLHACEVEPGAYLQFFVEVALTISNASPTSVAELLQAAIVKLVRPLPGDTLDEVVQRMAHLCLEHHWLGGAPVLPFAFQAPAQRQAVRAFMNASLLEPNAQALYHQGVFAHTVRFKHEIFRTFLTARGLKDCLDHSNEFALLDRCAGDRPYAQPDSVPQQHGTALLDLLASMHERPDELQRYFLARITTWATTFGDRIPRETVLTGLPPAVLQQLPTGSGAGQTIEAAARIADAIETAPPHPYRSTAAVIFKNIAPTVWPLLPRSEREVTLRLVRDHLQSTQNA